MTPLNRLREYIEGADQAGLSVAVHAIGDRANAELLDIFAEVAKKNGPRDRRFRIEHAQHLRPQDYRALQGAGRHRRRCSRTTPSTTAAGPRAASAPSAVPRRTPAARCSTPGRGWRSAPTGRWRRSIRLLGIDAAVNRRTLDGKHPEGWFPEQKIRVAEAIEAYTLTSAYAAFQEKDRGSLEVGKLADLVVLSRDILGRHGIREPCEYRGPDDGHRRTGGVAVKE